MTAPEKAPGAGGVPLIEARALTRAFGRLLANDRVDVAVAEGEIHALLGENGAGKSTLVKMFCGLLQPTSGEILWRGAPVRFADPRAAQRAGVGVVFQHFSLFDALTVAENIALALDARAADVADRVAEVSRGYGLPLEPGREVWRLSVGERQRVEIVRALMRNPRLLILDEPTSVLTPQEAEGLFGTLDRIRGEGRSILYISHKLDEVRRLCDRATILRHGKVAAACDPRRETAASLASLMVGQEVAGLRHDPHDGSGAERLVAAGLSLPPPDLHGTALKDIALSVRAGEILGIAGVAGNGQDELFAALSGESLAERPDAVMIDGAPVGRVGVTQRRLRGAAFVPEERLGHGAAPGFPLSENVLVSRHAAGGFVRRGFVDRQAARAYVAAITAAFDLRKATEDPPARALSGGNLQKFVVGREILARPGVLVVAQPTWGVDAGAARIIRQALIDLAKDGAAVLAISQDLDELFEISDRIAVLFHGRLAPARPTASLTREAVGLLMGGAAGGGGLEEAA
jgi:simple sugar transport system ATP-binding protein